MSAPHAELTATERHLDRLREGRPRNHRDHVIASRCIAGPPSNSLAHLFGGVSGARRRRRTAGPPQRRKRSPCPCSIRYPLGTSGLEPDRF
jgi:hypothetical protein